MKKHSFFVVKLCIVFTGSYLFCVKLNSPRHFVYTEVASVGDMDYVRILRDLREDADKTQTQIAEILGTSQTMYARYERGANELPIHHLITLSKYYGVSTDYLLGLSKER